MPGVAGLSYLFRYDIYTSVFAVMCVWGCGCMGVCTCVAMHACDMCMCIGEDERLIGYYVHVYGYRHAEA